MESIVGVMKKVAQAEVEKIFTTELGIVTAVFPHASESDKDNYQCSVKLKNYKQPDGQDFELRKVPVMTPHMGLVNIPNVGDLVLINFIGGNINAPIIIGRLYNDEDQPPVNKEKEFILQQNSKDGSCLKIDSEGVVTVTSKNQKNVFTVKDEEISAKTEKCNLILTGEDATLANSQCTVALKGGNITIDNGTCKITVETGGITIDAASSNVTVKSVGSIKIGDAATSSIQVGGRVLANAVGDNDDIILSTHTHVGNLGAPCPVMIPTEKINSIQAKIRNTQVG
ncbi:MAG: phage baseplate assembly protein V [Cyanobacteriota bacterium]